jgi:hypothetical protein
MPLILDGSLGVDLIQDGVVTANDLASTLDLTGKTVTLPSGVGGKLVAYQTYTNSVRQVTSSSTNYVAMDFNITKQFSNTLWVIEGLFSTNNHSINGGIYMYLELAGTREYRGIVRPYENNNEANGVHIKQLWSGVTAGSKNIKIGWSAIDGSSNRLFGVLNPDSNDDTRNRATGSFMTFYELAP